MRATMEFRDIIVLDVISFDFLGYPGRLPNDDVKRESDRISSCCSSHFASLMPQHGGVNTFVRDDAGCSSASALLEMCRRNTHDGPRNSQQAQKLLFFNSKAHEMSLDPYKHNSPAMMDST